MKLKCYKMKFFNFHFFLPISGVPIVDFELGNVSWVLNDRIKNSCVFSIAK